MWSIILIDCRGFLYSSVSVGEETYQNEQNQSLISRTHAGFTGWMRSWFTNRCQLLWYIFWCIARHIISDVTLGHQVFQVFRTSYAHPLGFGSHWLLFWFDEVDEVDVPHGLGPPTAGDTNAADSISCNALLVRKTSQKNADSCMLADEYG